MNERGRRGHDVGGSPAGRCRNDEHHYEPWELRADALGEALWGKAGAFKVDELRRLREDLGPDAYDHMGYYERWLHSLVQALIENGIVSVEEVARAMVPGAVEAKAPDGLLTASAVHAEPLFEPGQRVRVMQSDPPGHVRTPWYCRGKTGEVVAVCGSFDNPEDLAYPSQAVRKQPLYRVRFDARELWPGVASDARDTLEIEIYQHWLTKAERSPEG